MRVLTIAAVFVTAVCGMGSATCLAQVVFAPVQYQHSVSGQSGTYYYGGSNPRVQDYANRSLVESRYQRQGLQGFTPARPYNFDRSPVYSDVAPYVDFRGFGMTADDARNIAYAAVPRYFRKADLLRAAIEQWDGTQLVPANMAVASTSKQKRDSMGGRGVIVIIPREVAAPRQQTTGRTIATLAWSR